MSSGVCPQLRDLTLSAVSSLRFRRGPSLREDMNRQATPQPLLYVLYYSETRQVYVSFIMGCLWAIHTNGSNRIGAELKMYLLSLIRRRELHE